MGIIGRVVLGIVVIAAPIAWAQNVPGRANKQTTIFSFPGGAGGGNSHSGLVQASDGNFYGTLFYGGDNNMGTVYRAGPAGLNTKSLSDKWNPVAHAAC